MIARGWQATAFEVIETGWFFRSCVYVITFRKRLPPPQPGKPSILVAAEDEFMLQFNILLPAVNPETEFDVVTRQVLITVDGVVLEQQDVPADVLEFGPFTGAQNATVIVECRNVDDAGLVSVEASTLTALLVDTIPPPAPGEIQLVVTGEVADPVVEPEPEVPADPEPEVPADPEPEVPVE
jgi:hypothetical protein